MRDGPAARSLEPSAVSVFLSTLKDEKCHKNEDLNNQPLLVIQKHSPLYSTMYSS